MTDNNSNDKIDNKPNKKIKKSQILINPVMEDNTVDLLKRDETVVVSLLNMNPPVNEHDEFVDILFDICDTYNIDLPKIYIKNSITDNDYGELSSPVYSSRDNKKDDTPYFLIPSEDIVTITKDIYGDIIQTKSYYSINELLSNILDNYTHIVLVVDDEVSGELNFGDKVTVIKYGLNEIELSKEMTKLVINNEKDKFEKKLADSSEYISDEIFDMIASFVIDEMDDINEALNMQQRLKKAIVMRRYARKIQQAKKRMAHKIANTDMLKKRARRMAIQVLRKKIAGVKGMNYNKLSVGEKMQIDKRVETRKSAIARIATKLLPKLRKAEMEKFSKKGKMKVSEEIQDDQATPLKEPMSFKKRWHMLLTKEGKVKFDKRFRMYKNTKNLKEFLETIDDVLEQEEYKKIILALESRSLKSGISIDTLSEVYDRGVDSLNEDEEYLTASQKGFIRVDSFIAGNVLKEDKDLI